MKSKEQEIKIITIALFNDFYAKVTLNPTFALDLNMKKQGVILESFIKLLESKYSLNSIGLDFLKKYFLVQFSYWTSKKCERDIDFSWIVGKKAFKRWLDIKDLGREIYFGQEKFPPINYNFKNINNKFKQKPSEDLLMSEVIEKQRFYGTTRGFLNCLQRTTLYSKHKLCIACKFRDDCRSVLKNKFPKLYSDRLENN